MLSKYVSWYIIVWFKFYFDEYEIYISNTLSNGPLINDFETKSHVLRFRDKWLAGFSLSPSESTTKKVNCYLGNLNGLYHVWLPTCLTHAILNMSACHNYFN